MERIVGIWELWGRGKEKRGGVYRVNQKSQLGRTAEKRHIDAMHMLFV